MTVEVTTRQNTCVASAPARAPSAFCEGLYFATRAKHARAAYAEPA